MAPPLETGDLTLPTQVLDPWLGRVRDGSTVAALSNSIPMKFGAGTSMSFSLTEAEYVQESGEKSPATVTSTPKTVKPYKFHQTVRMSQEVKWADEDYQMGIVGQILDEIQPSLSRALDYGVFHGIDPYSGDVAATMDDPLSDTGNSVTSGADPVYTYLDAADQLVLAAGFVPSDAALDPSFAGGFSAARGTQSEMKLYPNFRLTNEVSDLEGHRASVNRTVGAVGVATVATGIKAFVGDFSAIRWGVQRNIGLELIEFGNPDGLGDLKRQNQIAFRAEIVYGWGIANLAAFAKVV